MPRIVVVGSINADMQLQVERIPQPGETVLHGSFVTAKGGKGANQAVAAARAGASVSMIARVGSDSMGHEAVTSLAAESINTEFTVFDDTAPTGVALIFVDAKGENSIGVASGANAKLSPTDVTVARDAIASADALLVQLEVPVETVEAAVNLAAAHDVPVILNPAPAQELPRELLSKVSILTPNEGELSALTANLANRPESMRVAVRSLHIQGVGTVIVTLGKQGVLVSTPSDSHLVDAYAVDAVDSTAAGDVFSGVLTVGRAEGLALNDAVAFANAAAALSVTRKGAQPSIPRRQEIDTFMANTPDGTA